ncbi:MAG: CHASE2 domain-containing protein, partial [Myxococcota bacterium]
MKKAIAWLTRVNPLRIAMIVALGFVAVHLVIEIGVFEFGIVSKKGFLRLLDRKLLDLKFANAPLDDVPPSRVVIAAIDEDSIEEYGLFPWNRNILADFVESVNAYGPKVIAFDVVFSDEDKNSSYVSVQRFLKAYETSPLRPESETFAALREQVSEAEAAFNKAEAKTETLRTRIRKDPKQSQKQQFLRLLADATADSERAQRRLVEARRALKQLDQSSSEYLKLMQDEVSAISPDQAFADAIEKAGNVILGYFAFEAEKQQIKIPLEERQRDLESLVPVRIENLYQLSIEDIGGATIERFEPVPADWSRLQLREPFGFQSPLPMFSERAKSFGFFNATIDPDNQIRRLRMLYKYREGMYPALALASTAAYFGDSLFPEDGQIYPGRTVDGVRIGSGRLIKTDGQAKMLVNYYANPQDYFPVCGIAALIKGECEALGNDLSRLKDTIVLVGATALGTFDVRPTAFGAVPGVFIHAAAMQNIIDGRFLERFYGIALVEVGIFIAIGLLLGLLLPRVPPWASLIVTLALAFGYYLIDIYFVFPRGLWILNVLPTLQAFVTLGAVVFYKYLTEGREKRQIRQAFQFYLTKSVVDEMLKDTSKLQLGGERRVCTVLFSDIRGFTTISESLEPEELSALLNEYLTPMTNLVFKYDGTLDKYMGDAIMAIFGAPVPYPDHATRACQVSLEMMSELGRLRDQWAREGREHSIDIGIGLNTGPMSVGNMGSEVRFDYTVMGDQVNLGSRLEGINKQYGTNIII